MKIIFAQGNPGETYVKTRHNIGFIVLDKLASDLGTSFADKSKFHASVAETTIEGEKILLVKPLTFYNETGLAARALIDFYKLDPGTDFLVVHDELALPFGTIKTRPDGSDAGNNGIKSLNSHIGPQYARIRIGIYNPLRDQINDADFVLGRFSTDEQELLPQVIEQAQGFITSFLQNNLESTKITLL